MAIVKQGGIEVSRGKDIAVPVSGATHADRGARLDKLIQAGQAKRRDEMAARPVVNPSANPLPGLTNAPKVALDPAFKKK